jgi:hypothetical protein
LLQLGAHGNLEKTRQNQDRQRKKRTASKHEWGDCDFGASRLALARPDQLGDIRAPVNQRPACLAFRSRRVPCGGEPVPVGSRLPISHAQHHSSRFAVTALLGLVALLLPLAERFAIPYAVLLALVGSRSAPRPISPPPTSRGASSAMSWALIADRRQRLRHDPCRHKTRRTKSELI